MQLKRQGRSGMLLVYFFGAHVFAWVSKKCVQLWNADVDVPDEKRPLLQKFALQEAYEWQKDVFTKPPTRRRNPEPVKPKYDPKQKEVVLADKKALLEALKVMYKQQAKEIKLEKRKARALARGEPLPDDFEVSSDDDDETASNKSGLRASTPTIAKEGNATEIGEEEESNDDSRSVASSNKSKSNKPSSSRNTPSAPSTKNGAKHTSSSSSSNSADHELKTTLNDSKDAQNAENEEMEAEDTREDEEDEEEDEDEISGSVSGSASGAVDDLTDIDLSSAIQRGKFILRARRNETLPPKKRKYTRRAPLSSSASHDRETSKNDHKSSKNEISSPDDSAGRKKKGATSSASQSTSTSTTAAKSPSLRSSQRLQKDSGGPLSPSKDAGTNFVSSSSQKHTNASESASSNNMLVDDEVEALKLANTIASRRKLRRSTGNDEDLVSLPLSRPKHTKDASSAANNIDGDSSSGFKSSHSMNSVGSSSKASGSGHHASNAYKSSTSIVIDDEEGDTASSKGGKSGGNSSDSKSASDRPSSSQTGLTSSLGSNSTQPNSSSSSHAQGASANNNSGVGTNGTASASNSAKKTGRGKYIRKGKRGAAATASAADSAQNPISADSASEQPLCASCALAKPNYTRNSLGVFMFYMLEDHVMSKRKNEPRYRCTVPRCNLRYFTEFELKMHTRTHFDHLQGVFAEPPMKRVKYSEQEEDDDANVVEDDEEESGNTNANGKSAESDDKDAKTTKKKYQKKKSLKRLKETSSASASDKNTSSAESEEAKKEKESDSALRKNAETSEENAKLSNAMEVDGEAAASSSTTISANGPSSATKNVDSSPKDSSAMNVDEQQQREQKETSNSSEQKDSAAPKECSRYYCEFEGCESSFSSSLRSNGAQGNEEEVITSSGAGKSFSSLAELREHVEKVHCGGISHRSCSRCGSKNVYSLPSSPASNVSRAAARAKVTSTPATNCIHGRGRRLPFAPFQGIAPPNMISMPLQNLSYQPPSVPSPTPSPLAHAAVLSPPQTQQHMLINSFNPIPVASPPPPPQHLQHLTEPQLAAAMQQALVAQQQQQLHQQQQQQLAQQMAHFGMHMAAPNALQNANNTFNALAQPSPHHAVTAASRNAQSNYLNQQQQLQHLRDAHSSMAHAGGNNNNLDDGGDGDRPKRSTRIRRTSAAAAQMQASQMLTSPYGHLSSKQARAAAQEAKEAARAAKAISGPLPGAGMSPSGHAPAPFHSPYASASVHTPSSTNYSGSLPATPAQHAAPFPLKFTPSPSAAQSSPASSAANSKKKYKVTPGSASLLPASTPVAASRPPPKDMQSLAAPLTPAALPAATANASPPSAAAAGGGMGALLDLINLCSSMVE